MTAVEQQMVELIKETIHTQTWFVLFLYDHNIYCIHIVHCYARQRAGSKIRDVDNNDTGFVHVLDQFFKPGAHIEKVYEAWQSSTPFAEEGTIYIASSFEFLHKPNALVCAVRGGVTHAQ